MIIQNELFEEIGCDEMEDTTVPRDVIEQAFRVDDSFDEYIREYQAEASASFEDLVNMS
jgi:hypothetical protein